MEREVLVVVGVGGMGRAVARRLGPGRVVLLADRDEATLGAAAAGLGDEGHEVVTRPVDVAAPDQVAALAAAAAALGRVGAVVHTAGLSPVQASVAAIVAVDLLGTAHVLEAFGEVVAPGGAGVAIASMAGHLGAALGPDDEEALARTPAAGLLGLACLSPATLTDPGLAYALAKRANQLRVQAASVAWGERGARLNSISPGVIATPMGAAELASATGPIMRAMVAASATGRLGTPDDVAAAAAFLLGPEAAFVTGTDLLVDGGVVAGLRAGRLDLGG